MEKKILRKQLDVTVGTDTKPELVFNGTGKIIFLYMVINGKGYGCGHLRTRRSLKKAMERFAVIFQNSTMGRLDLNEENIAEEIHFCIEMYERAEMRQDVRTSLRLSIAALILAAAAFVWTIMI